MNRAFTLVELLVVISIVALLMAIMLPALDKARSLQRQVVCLSQARQINGATAAYATENWGFMPARGAGASWPQHIAPHVSGQAWDLNRDFVEPYLNARNRIMFCPTVLNDVRGPDAMDADYRYKNITYQYYNPPMQGFSGVPLNAWATRKPVYETYSSAKPQLPLWGCLTHQKPLSGNIWLAHDRALTPDDPPGMSSARVDGSGHFVRFSELEPFLRDGGMQTYWWPITAY